MEPVNIDPCLDFPENRVWNGLLTTDELKAYLTAMKSVFGNDIDYAMLQKNYGEIARKVSTDTAPRKLHRLRNQSHQGQPGHGPHRHVARGTT